MIDKPNKKSQFTNSDEYGACVQLYHKANNDIVYYAVYRDLLDVYENGKPKKKRFKTGLKSQGITETYTKHVYDEICVALRRGEVPDILQKTIPKEVVTFKDIATQYFEERSSNYPDGDTNKNLLNDKSLLNNHLFNFLNVKADSITSKDIINLKNSKRNYSSSTVNNILILARSIFNYGLRHNLIKNIPAITIKKTTNERTRWLTTEEIFLLYDLLKDNKTLLMFVKIALNTGARLTTILEIRRNNINIESQTITLTDYKKQNLGGNNVTYFGYISDQIIHELCTFIEDVPVAAYIFRNNNGNRLGVDYIQNNLQKIFDAHFNNHLARDKNNKIIDTLNKVVIHTLRHTFATHLRINGVALEDIKKLLNHSDLKTTERYSKFSDQAGKKAIATLEVF